MSPIPDESCYASLVAQELSKALKHLVVLGDTLLQLKRDNGAPLYYSNSACRHIHLLGLTKPHLMNKPIPLGA
jgi:hypothetical protein